jgi:hypothetical protein
MINISFCRNSPFIGKPRFWITIVFFLACLIGCRTGQTISQGISGKVLWFEGDLMPGIDKEPVEGVPVEREIYIYRPTRTDQAELQDHVFYSEIRTELVKKINTGPEGKFTAKLEPGLYSLFVKEPRGLFANRFSEEGYINPVRVIKGEVTPLTIRIDYRAAY